MCQIAIDPDYQVIAPPLLLPLRAIVPMLGLAVTVGAAMGFAETQASVTWPPVVGLMLGCAGLAVAAPRAAWGLGLLAGLAAAAADLCVGHGRPTLLHVGLLGPFGAVLAALAAAHVGLWIALVADRVRSRRTMA